MTEKANRKKRPFQYFPMDAGRLVCSPLLLIYRHRRLGTDGKPYRSKIKGGAIIAANHTSFADPFLVGSTFWYRRLFCLTAKEVMKNGLRSLLLKGMGCIKIDREKSDLAAIRTSIALLKQQKLLCIFPQGGIQQQTEREQIKAGMILIALQAGVPIVPCYTAKRPHWWNRQIVVIGEPICCRDVCKTPMPSVSEIQTLSQVVFDHMKECKKTYEQHV